MPCFWGIRRPFLWEGREKSGGLQGENRGIRGLKRGDKAQKRGQPGLFLDAFDQTCGWNGTEFDGILKAGMI